MRALAQQVVSFFIAQQPERGRIAKRKIPVPIDSVNRFRRGFEQEPDSPLAFVQRAQEALHESEGRIRLLLESTAEAIYGIDRDGNFTFCNPATLRLLGYEKGYDLLGKSAHKAMHHSRSDGTPYPIQECPIVDSRL